MCLSNDREEAGGGTWSLGEREAMTERENMSMFMCMYFCIHDRMCGRELVQSDPMSPYTVTGRPSGGAGSQRSAPLGTGDGFFSDLESRPVKTTLIKEEVKNKKYIHLCSVSHMWGTV